LFIQYFNSSAQWATLFQHLGSGTDMVTFNQASVLLGPDAHHSAFRIRVRSVGSNSANDDDWFVDDLRIDRPPVSNVMPVSLNAYLPQNDSTEEIMVINNAGAGQLTWNASVVYLDKSNAVFEKAAAEGRVQPASREYSEGFLEYFDDKGSDAPFLGYPVTRDVGGPDAYGYVWVDSDEPGGPVFSWIDITATGTDVIASLDDDNYSGPYNIGFGFPFYGNVYNQVYVGSNGIVGFATDSMFSRFKVSIPNTKTPDNMLAWLWDDLDPTNINNPGAHVYVGMSGSNFVIQFVNYPEYGALVGDVVNAEVILYPNGDIIFQYLTVAPGFDIANCAIGIENADGSDGLEVAFLAAYLKNNLAVKFSTPFQWIGLSKGAGQLLAGQGDTVIVKILSGELADGNYSANIVINSNDPNGANNPFVVSAALTVSSLPP
ncbi:MAG: hypothetical protein ACREBV_08985, partial [Candidatus Zixiibacteriota bacterium]